MLYREILFQKLKPNQTKRKKKKKKEKQPQNTKTKKNPAKQIKTQTWKSPAFLVWCICMEITVQANGGMLKKQ